ncbi:hypothetical protein V8E55_005296 [Tylopilus felleus]
MLFSSVHVVPISILNSNRAIILATICFSVAAGMDIIIAIYMTFFLLRERATSSASMVHLLQRLTIFAVNTGIWTATFAVLCLIMLHIFRSSLIYTVFGFPLGTVYCNTVLANLNARVYLQVAKTTHDVDVDLFRSSGSRVANSTQNDRRPGRGQRMVAFSTNES